MSVSKDHAEMYEALWGDADAAVLEATDCWGSVMSVMLLSRAWGLVEAARFVADSSDGAWSGVAKMRAREARVTLERMAWRSQGDRDDRMLRMAGRK